jgi:hypothetical protein
MSLGEKATLIISAYVMLLLAAQLHSRYNDFLHNTDALLFSDYGYGTR